MSVKRFLSVVALVFGLCLSAAVLAAPIQVLWYTGGVQDSGSGFATYEDAVNDLASRSGNPWTVTFWDGIDVMPGGTFNVMVVASPVGAWDTDPGYLSLQAAAGDITWGDRLMLTGQDADWHYINNPGPTNFDGPQGFLLDSINWAGNGNGMGLVALGMNGLGTCSAVDFGLTGYSADCASTETVDIPAAYASFPINTGLTSAGLSNWAESAHAGFFDIDPLLWTAINVDGEGNCDAAPDPCYVTIVSAATASGGIGVPEPAALGMFGLGVLLLGVFAGMRRRAFQR